MAKKVSDSDTGAKRIAATGLIMVVVVCVTLSLLLFNQAFQRRVPLTVVSDRAGLVMDVDAKVRSRGVEIGTVSQIRQELGGAVLELEVDPDALEAIPANSVVHIGSNTIFGAKSVDFLPPRSPSPQPLTRDAVVPAAQVTTEINTMFEDLNRLLVAVEPEKLNSSIGAIADALNGRGDQLGQTLADLDGYLKEINPQIDTLQRDLVLASKVTNLYADVTPDLMRMLDAGTTVGNTLVANQQQFEALLASAAAAGDSGKVARGPVDGGGPDAGGPDTGSAGPTRALDAATERALRKEMNKTERQIAKLDQRETELHAAMADAAGQALDTARLADLDRELKTVVGEKEALEERWMEIGDQLEG